MVVVMVVVEGEQAGGREGRTDGPDWRIERQSHPQL